MSGNSLHAGWWARPQEDRSSPPRGRPEAPRLPRRLAAPAWCSAAAGAAPCRTLRPRWQLAAPTAWRFLLGLHDRLLLAPRWSLRH